VSLLTPLPKSTGPQALLLHTARCTCQHCAFSSSSQHAAASSRQVVFLQLLWRFEWQKHGLRNPDRKHYIATSLVLSPHNHRLPTLC
jgi:hypothetical protein